MNTSIQGRERDPAQKIGLAWQKYAAVLQVSVANNVAYLVEVVFRAIFLLMFMFIFLQLWTVTFAARGVHALGGFTISDMVWYLAATETIALSLPPLTRQIDLEVRSGQLAYLLGRPCNYVLYHFAQYLGERLVRLVINIPVAATLALIFVGLPDFSWMGIAAWPLVALLAVSIDFVVYFSIGLLAFWTEETTPFFLIINRLALVLGGVLAPLEVLPQPIRGISQVLPFSAVFYGPARTLVHFELDRFGWLLAQQSVTLAIGSFVLVVIYKVATRRVNINGG